MALEVPGEESQVRTAGSLLRSTQLTSYLPPTKTQENKKSHSQWGTEKKYTFLEDISKYKFRRYLKEQHCTVRTPNLYRFVQYQTGIKIAKSYKYIHLFNTYLPMVYYVPDKVLRSNDTVGGRREALMELKFRGAINTQTI